MYLHWTLTLLCFVALYAAMLVYLLLRNTAFERLNQYEM
jgi:hypothetical protein